MKEQEFIYRTKELCLNKQGNILEQKILDFGPDPILGELQAGTYAFRKMKQIERDPAGFLKDLGLREASTELHLDVHVSIVLCNKMSEEDLFLFSVHGSNEDNLKREKNLLKKCKEKRSKKLLRHYESLFKKCENPEEVRHNPYPAPCFFRTKKLRQKCNDEDEIIEERDFCPQDYRTYIEMKKAANDHHNDSIPDDYDPLNHIEHILNHSNPELSEYSELYLVLADEGEEREILRLRNNAVNFDGMNLDLYFQTLYFDEHLAFVKAEKKYFMKKVEKKKKRKKTPK